MGVQHCHWRFMRRGAALVWTGQGVYLSRAAAHAAAATDEDDAALRSGINQEGDTDVRVYRDDEDARLLFKSVASKSCDDPGGMTAMRRPLEQET